MPYELYVFGGNVKKLIFQDEPKRYFAGMGYGILWDTYTSREMAERHGEGYIESHPAFSEPKYKIVETDKKLEPSEQDEYEMEAIEEMSEDTSPKEFLKKLYGLKGR